MKIAWRYQNQAAVSATDATTTTSTHSFNLQKTLSKSVLEQCDAHSWSPPPFENDVEDFYRDAFVQLSSVAGNESFNVTPQTSPPDVAKNILRVAFQNVGSTLWCDDCDAANLSKFVFALRSLARHHLAVVVITTSRASLVTRNEASLARIRSLCDVVIQLTPFSKEERKTGLFKDHHGVLVTFRILTSVYLCSDQRSRAQR